MGDIAISNGVRANLMALQSTAKLMETTQSRLSTGNRVNSALDNPANFFTASAMNNRASDLSSLLDSMSTGVNTLKAADAALTSITKLVESAQGTARQALQDASGEKTASVTGTSGVGSATTKVDAEAKLLIDDLGFVGAKTEITTGVIDGATDAATLGAKALAGDLGFDATDVISFKVTGADGGTASLDFAVTASNTLDDLKTAIAAEFGDDLALDFSADDGTMTLVSANGKTVDVSFTDTSSTTSNDLQDLFGASVTVNGTAGVAVDDGTADTQQFLKGDDTTLTFNSTKDGVTSGVTVTIDSTTTVKDLVDAINEQSGGAISATIDDAGVLTVAAANGSDLGFELNGEADDLSELIAGNSATSISAPTADVNGTRTRLAEQFNNILNQITDLAQDADFNGINLLQSDDLKVLFNEKTGSNENSLSISGVDFDADGLGLTSVTANFQSDTEINNSLDEIKDALTSLRSQASTFGSNLTTVQTRQDFTNSLINVLESGASDLTLADTNAEGANMLALQTRQSLATTTMGMASQADQSVLSFLR